MNLCNDILGVANIVHTYSREELDTICVAGWALISLHFFDSDLENTYILQFGYGILNYLSYQFYTSTSGTMKVRSYNINGRSWKPWVTLN